MKDCPTDLRRFSQHLLGAQQIQAMYPPEHPRVSAAIREFYLQTADLLETRSEIKIALADDEIVFDGTPVTTSLDLTGGLAALLRRQGVGRLLVNDGLRRWEVSAFVRALNASPEELAQAGGIEAMLAGHGIEHISAGPLRTGKADEPAVSARDALPAAWQTYSKGLKTLRHVRNDLISGRETKAIAATADLANDLVRTIREQPDVFLLLHALQDHDEYSFTHSLNVAMLSLTIARRMKLSGEALMAIAVAALLHDIGKERVPDEVLNKPGRLSEQEWGIMQRHSADGAKLLLRSPSASDLSVVVAYEHQLAYEHDNPDHGRWNLHFVSDLVCIADVYDALRSNRPYRAALPADEAMQIMEEEAPKKFDPEIFAGFRRMFGHYPPGTILELDNGYVAVSLCANPEDATRPRMLAVRDPGGADMEPPRPVDLVDHPKVNVARVLSVDEAKIDPLDYL